jgi:hypothetical protein
VRLWSDSGVNGQLNNRSQTADVILVGQLTFIVDGQIELS